MNYFNLGEHSHLREYNNNVLALISQDRNKFSFSERDAARSILAERRTTTKKAN